MLRRHQFGSDRERRRNHAAGADAGQQAQDDQLLGRLHQGDQQCQKCRQEDADQHDALTAQMVGHGREKEAAEAQHEGRADSEPAYVGVGQVQRRLGQHQQRAGHHQIVALDEADEGEHGDDQDVVAAERDAVELAPEHKAGRSCRSNHRANFCHGDLPDSMNLEEHPHRAPPSRGVTALGAQAVYTALVFPVRGSPYPSGASLSCGT
jgi:hypothetical protein